VEGARSLEVLSGWASRYVHALGLCSPHCHGEGSRKHRGVDALDRAPPTEDLFLLDLDQDWAGRALASDRVVVGLRRIGSGVYSVCIDLQSGRWAERWEWSAP
jgi:hypothetical protein